MCLSGSAYIDEDELIDRVIEMAWKDKKEDVK